jgi:hypothetical protein
MTTTEFPIIGKYAISRRDMTYQGRMYARGELIRLAGNGDERLAEHHMIAEFGGDPARCDQCDSVFADEHGLAMHEDKRHSDPEKPKAPSMAYAIVQSRVGLRYCGVQYDRGEILKLQGLPEDTVLLEAGQLKATAARAHLCTRCGKAYANLDDHDAHAVSEHVVTRA